MNICRQTDAQTRTPRPLKPLMEYTVTAHKTNLPRKTNHTPLKRSEKLAEMQKVTSIFDTTPEEDYVSSRLTALTRNRPRARAMTCTPNCDSTKSAAVVHSRADEVVRRA